MGLATRKRTRVTALIGDKKRSAISRASAAKLRTHRAKVTHEKKKQMLQALLNSDGNVSVACAVVGITRKTHYIWTNEDEWYREEVGCVGEKNLDLAETTLLNKIKKGDTTSTIFFLKTKGKKRGYIERSEHELANRYGEVFNLATESRQQVSEQAILGILQKLQTGDN